MGLKPSNIHRRGFASMDPEKRKLIAAKGGERAHALGRAYQWNSETAAVAGARGAASRKARRAARAS